MSDINQSDDEGEEIVSEASFIPSDDDDDDDDDYSDEKIVVQKKSPSMKSKPTPSKPTPPSPRKVAKGTSKATIRNGDTVATKSNKLVTTAKRMVKNEDDEDFGSTLNSSLTPPKVSSVSKNSGLAPNIKRPRTDSGRAAVTSIYQSDGYDLLVRPSILQDVATTANHEFSLLIQIDSINTATTKPPIRMTSGSVMGRLELLPSHGHNQVKFDFHGTEYTGRVYPGPTAMVLSVEAPPAQIYDQGNESLAVLNVDQILHEFCHMDAARYHPDRSETTGNVVSIPKVDYFQYSDDINVNQTSTAAPTTTHTSPHDDLGIVSTKRTKSGTTKKSKSTVTNHHNPIDHNMGATTTTSSSIQKTQRSKK